MNLPFNVILNVVTNNVDCYIYKSHIAFQITELYYKHISICSHSMLSLV